MFARTSKNRSRGDRGLVPAERIVVAADQGTGSRLPRVLQDAVRDTAVSRLTAMRDGPTLVTGAAGFAGGHLASRQARTTEDCLRHNTCSK